MRKLVLGMAMAVTACGGTASVKQAAQEVESFHHELDAGNYEAIWQASAPAMKASATKADFEKLMAAVHTKLGNTRKSTQSGWRVNATTGGTFTVVGQDTEYARGKAAETFTFQSDGKRLRLVGYNINSREMIIN